MLSWVSNDEINSLRILKSVKKKPIEIIDTLLFLISWKYLWLFGMTDWRENIPQNPTLPMLW